MGLQAPPERDTGPETWLYTYTEPGICHQCQAEVSGRWGEGECVQTNHKADDIGHMGRGHACES